MRYRHAYEVRFIDTGPDDRITPHALFNLMQETAIHHSESVGWTPQRLLEAGGAWMLNRIVIDIAAFPIRKDRLEVETWPSNLTGLYATREFQVFGQETQCVARASARWVFIDMTKKRAVRIPGFIPETYGVDPAHALTNDFPRMSNIDAHDHLHTFHVRHSDLDNNLHANSACYIDWCLEALPENWRDRATLTRFDINYKREALQGDVLRAATCDAEPDATKRDGGRGFYHTVTRAADDALLCIARSHWSVTD